MSSRGWIGCDLDETLAVYEDGMAAAGVVGAPIEPMVKRIKQHLADGYTVKIFTARVNAYPGWDHEKQRRIIEKWTKKIFGVKLEVTNVKDFNMIFLYDDRCVSVEPRTGRLLAPPFKLRPL
jgi:hypothetical protein